jgi:hypothetical protein
VIPSLLVHTNRAFADPDTGNIYFSVLQRKVVSPNDFTDLTEVEHRLTEFEKRYNATATPFDWKFTRNDLHDLLDRINQHEQQDNTTTLPTAA